MRGCRFLSYDMLWRYGTIFSSAEEPNPNWSGYMQTVTNKKYQRHEKSGIKFLPIIDLDPTNETCIYSTLLFVIDQAKKMNITTPAITFDQPLWLKATSIIKEEKLDMVCRLGGFHALMSFIGSVGNLMNGSGIEELFAEVYAENSVIHMLSGKAVARALRAHFLAQGAIFSVILDTLVADNKIDLAPFKDIYEKSVKGDLQEAELEEVCQSEQFKVLENALVDFIQSKSLESRTAKLWLQYADYITTVKLFIFAERTSNWFLHIDAMKRMINLFAATGHINYAKSARIYIQEMEMLSETYPWLFDQFQNGLHAVKRTKKNWNGLWTDLVIEQTMMRSLKTRGGLTRGRGFTDTVRHLWVLSLNFSAAVHDNITSLSGSTINSSEQHAEMGFSRRVSDFSDFKKFKVWFEHRNPFSFADSNLYSLSTGVISINGQDEVNCENAEIIGRKIHEGLDKVTYPDAKIRKCDQLKSLGSLQNSLKVSDKSSICVNPTILFTRLAAIAQREDEVECCFEFELSTSPLSLFKNGLMRKPDKSSLRKVLLTEEDQCPATFNNCIYIVDGGALLHRVYWVKGMAFKEIVKTYVEYVKKNYGFAYVVFDGYDSSTKSNEHLRRGQGKVTQDVVIKEDNLVPYAKDRFLASTNNKIELINLISKHLTDDGQNVYQCKADADTKIVSTALHIAADANAVVVADDTDIAMMLLHHWNEEMFEIYFLQERGKKCWNIKQIQPKITSIKEHLLFVHAWSGCDTTSAIYGKGKPSFLKMVKKSEDLQSVSEKMSDYWATHEEISESAVSAFKIIYGGNSETLTKMR